MFVMSIKSTIAWYDQPELYVNEKIRIWKATQYKSKRIPTMFDNIEPEQYQGPVVQNCP